MPEEKNFETASLQLAAYLKAHRIPYQRTYLSLDRNTVFFVFTETPDLPALVTAYTENAPSAPPKTLFWVFRELSNDAKHVRENGGGAR